MRVFLTGATGAIGRAAARRLVEAGLGVLCAAAPAAAAPLPDCVSAYRPEFSEKWGISASSWRTDCASGRGAAEALRSGQEAFQRSCERDFASLVEGERMASFTVKALCAQGASGRRRLQERLDASGGGSRAGTSAAAAAAGPGRGGMGPMLQAVEVARGRWGRESCLQAAAYLWRPTTLNKATRRKAAQDDLEPFEDHLEAYHFFFHSPRLARETGTVSYADKVDAAFNILLGRMDGPHLEEDAWVAGDCLVEPRMDLAGALELSGRAGLDVGAMARVHAALVSPGAWSEAYAKCRRGLQKGLTFWCDHALSSVQERGLSGKALWVVGSRGRTAFLDAAKGELLFSADGRYQSILLHHAQSFSGWHSLGDAATEAKHEDGP